ncbi:MAG: hypothetical protein ACFFCH_05180 [Promethearchaeota archaeon]
MSDQETAATLLLIAAILQLLIAIGFFIGIITIPLAIVGLVFAILWLQWRSDPLPHKTGMIVTGILALILTGVIPGILALVAGVVLPDEKGGA